MDQKCEEDEVYRREEPHSGQQKEESRGHKCTKEHQFSAGEIGGDKEEEEHLKNKSTVKTNV